MKKHCTVVTDFSGPLYRNVDALPFIMHLTPCFSKTFLSYNCNHKNALTDEELKKQEAMH